MRPLFVTGTGTDIGKTHVLCALLSAHRAAGGQARILKPVISGFDPAQANETDTIRLMRANGDSLTAENVQAVSPWRFRPGGFALAVSPFGAVGSAACRGRRRVDGYGVVIEDDGKPLVFGPL